MGEPVHLLGGGRDHSRVAVTGVQHGNAAGKVNEAAPLDIPKLCIQRPLGIEGRRVRQGARHRGLTAGVEGGVGLRVHVDCRAIQMIFGGRHSTVASRVDAASNVA